MNIGIIGSGMVGKQLGLGLTKLGYNVKLGTRDSSKLADWLKEAGNNASADSFEEAAKFGDINILCTFWAGTENAVNMAGKENFSGKILIDVTNPLDFSQGTPPKFAATPGNSGGEQIQRWLPDAKVVKAFNTINAFVMINPKREEGDPDFFYAGNNEDAKKEVVDIAKKLGWKSFIDFGNISASFWLESLTMVWIDYAFKYNIWSHAFKLLKK
jgi:8-hydroxy-5-deazaflavin:NADPH oxidoreductase